MEGDVAPTRRARSLAAVVGHVPQRVRSEDADIEDVQHLRGLARVDGREPILDPLASVLARTAEWAELTPERFDFAVRTSLEQGIVHTPTLVLFDRGPRFAHAEELIEAPAMRLLPRFYGEIGWDSRGSPLFGALDAGYWTLAGRVPANAKRLVGPRRNRRREPLPRARGQPAGGAPPLRRRGADSRGAGPA